MAEFTKEMKSTHTLLMPSMLPIHFSFFKNVFTDAGYNIELLTNESPDVITEGLKYIHNDTCYPALLVIGQFIDFLNKRGKTDDVVLLITQTGGGCRASNYIHLLKKALIKADYAHIPVIALNFNDLKNAGAFEFDFALIKKLAAAMTYGDMMMYINNKVRSYEINKGESALLTTKWIERLSNDLKNKKGLSFREIKQNLNKLALDYDKIEVDISKQKPKVGVVGEIYIKYSYLGNNHLEDFLIDEGAEVLVPGLYGFVSYSFMNNIYDAKIYGLSKKKYLLSKFILHYLYKRERAMQKAMQKTKYSKMGLFKHTTHLSEGIISHGVKMGEGWLLTAEMIELIEMGFTNIVCAQPFGCLPNHICGKGVIKKIKELYPTSNIVAIDYDASQTKVNQENRLKLMLAIARENIDKEEKAIL